MAKEKAKPAAAPAEAVVEKPKKSKLIVLVIIVLLLLGGGGAAAWFFMSSGSTKRGGESHQADEKKKPPVFVSLDKFTVNLPSADSTDHYLMVGVEMKVADQKMADAVKAHMPEIRNSVLLMLSGKTVEELSTLQGKKKLSADIVKQVNDTLHLKKSEAGATDTLFTEFVIQ